MTKQWDKYREIIIAEYKDQNKPLHEVQRVMEQRYGFKASTRAYRSRFDRWGIHKYSRRRRSRSMSPERRDSTSDRRPSPEPGLDADRGSPHAPSPAVTTPLQMLGTTLCGLMMPAMAPRSPLGLVKPEYHQYTPVTPAPSPAIAQSPGFHLNHFGGGMGGFGAQDAGHYSSGGLSMCQHNPRDVLMVAPTLSGPGQCGLSMNDIQAGYGYSLGILASHQ